MGKDRTLSIEHAQKIYDRIGAMYDWAAIFEGRAKAYSLEELDLSTGQLILNVGVGTGREQKKIIGKSEPNGIVHGVDLSWVMAQLTQKRCGTPVCQANARYLPYADGKFERLYCTYVLDLLPQSFIPGVLREFFRVMAPGGKIVIAALTEGVTPISRGLVALWKKMFDLSPTLCAGCRPLQLGGSVQEGGFTHISREVIVEFAVPSEIISAIKPQQ
jgi:ubiquinone/menaquinone biosynthesis C-methylase UbiE